MGKKSDNATFFEAALITVKMKPDGPGGFWAQHNFQIRTAQEERTKVPPCPALTTIEVMRHWAGRNSICQPCRLPNCSTSYTTPEEHKCTQSLARTAHGSVSKSREPARGHRHAGMKTSRLCSHTPSCPGLIPAPHGTTITPPDTTPESGAQEYSLPKKEKKNRTLTTPPKLTQYTR